ncbi:hypothetical protein ACFS07_09080 [Undibacterium arcticum]
MLADCEKSSKRTRLAMLRRSKKLATYHPKKEYWNDLLSRTLTKPGFFRNV